MFLTVKRLSDGTTYLLDFEPKTRVREVKKKLRQNFTPKYPQGCRLVYNGHILKSRHSFKYYGINADTHVDMDDTKNWTSSSESSEVED